MIHIWRPRKLSYFKDPSLPLSIYFQNPCTPWPWTSNFKRKSSLQMITNQLKENIIQGSDLSLRLVFVFNTNSLILSGSPLTSFHLAEASLSVFSWLYTLVCPVVQKYHDMLFIYNYSFFTFLVLVLQSTNICTTWKRKQTMEQQPHRACERTKSNWPRVVLFNLAHKQCSNGTIKGWLHSLTSDSKGNFLSIC